MKKRIDPEPQLRLDRRPSTSRLFDSFALDAGELRLDLLPLVNTVRRRDAVSALSGDLEGNRHSPEYNFVGYPSKKPYEPIEMYIRHFTNDGDLMLDPFCGSGGVGLVANQLGRHAICVDASSLACRISKAYSTRVDSQDIRQGFARLDALLDSNRKQLYGTTCHLTGQAVEVDAIVWSQTTRCIKCFEVIAIADLRGSACPKCGQSVKARYERLGAIPWGARYRSSGHGKVLRTASDSNRKARLAFEQYDQPTATTKKWNPADKGFVDRSLMNHDGPGPWGILWRPYHGKVRTVGGFFTRRNLWALCDIKNAIAGLDASDDVKNVLSLALASVTHPASKQQRYYPGSTFPNMVMPGVLFFPAVHEEVNVYQRFFSKQRSLVRGQTAINDRLGTSQTCVIRGTADDLAYVPTESVDYVFTDPPYSGRIQYGELLFLQEAILGLDTSWLTKELIVNEVRGIDLDQWAVKLEQCMLEVYRTLKPGRWASVCFHDSSPASWVKLQNVMLKIGFIPGPADRASSMHTGWQTLKMHTSEDITKRDLVVNFYKPRSEELGTTAVEITPSDDAATFRQKAERIIRDELFRHPGQKKDRIYDAVVARMVARSELEHHNFDEILIGIAEKSAESAGPARWYLKGKELENTDAAESAKEELAAQAISGFIRSILAKNRGQEGVHYSDIFEHYVYSVTDKPRRLLVDWMPDYFFKTEFGTWRLPASEEEDAIKAEGRRLGMTHKIKRFVSCIEAGISISSLITVPSNNDITDWIRHCRRSGLYEQGKLLYEKGGLNLDQLLEEAQVNVEEDYQVCVRMLSRETAVKPVKGKRGRKSGQPELDI